MRAPLPCIAHLELRIGSLGFAVCPDYPAKQGFHLMLLLLLLLLWPQLRCSDIQKISLQRRRQSKPAAIFKKLDGPKRVSTTKCTGQRISPSSEPLQGRGILIAKLSLHELQGVPRDRFFTVGSSDLSPAHCHLALMVWVPIRRDPVLWASLQGPFCKAHPAMQAVLSKSYATWYNR